jgi:predicted transcriptional regulator
MQRIMKLNLEPETIRTNVSFRLDNKVIEFIKELAKDNDASESKIMEHIIKDFMKRFVSINY